MRTRLIKPAFFDNELLSDLPHAARLLFIGLWCMADREGRLEDRPRKIRGEVFPFEPSTDIDVLLWRLHATGFIVRYSVEGTDFIQVINFKRHQSIHSNETPSEIPEAQKGATRENSEQVRNWSPSYTSTYTSTSGLKPSSPDGEDERVPRITVKQFQQAKQAPVAPVNNAPSELLPKLSGSTGAEKPAQPTLAQLQEEYFEREFWPLAWRKVDKEDARRAFRKHATSETKIVLIIEALKKHRPSMLVRQAQHRPHIATWLNKLRYNEEPEPIEDEIKSKQQRILDQLT
jgi:hypothetical protein